MIKRAFKINKRLNDTFNPVVLQFFLFEQNKGQ